MKSKVAAAALCAVGLAMSMSAANAARFGDENDTSWLYSPPSAKVFPAAKIAEPIVRFGDENDTSWLYSPPSAKVFPAAKIAKPIVRFGDENDLSWLYRPASGQDSATASRGAPAKDL